MGRHNRYGVKRAVVGDAWTIYDKMDGVIIAIAPTRSKARARACELSDMDRRESEHGAAA